MAGVRIRRRLFRLYADDRRWMRTGKKEAQDIRAIVLIQRESRLIGRS